MRTSVPATICGLAALTALFASVALGYTTAQAERGKADYEKNCSECHNSDLNGTAKAPALHGDAFLKTWESGSVYALFVKLRDSMPAGHAASITEAEKIDILAFLLQVNGIPAGQSELKSDRKELESVQIAPKGQQTVPNFAVVRLVGCLTPASGKSWTLTRTTEPEVTHEDMPTPAALKDAAEKMLGSGAFGLLGAVAFKPESHAGQKMEARGLLYRDSGRNLLNLTSLETTGQACGN
jgi:mono/diheme cytochrome c family protein